MENAYLATLDFYTPFVWNQVNPIAHMMEK